MAETRPLDRAVRRNDAEIVEKARSGDRSAFAELVERYKDVVFALAFSATGSAADSDDVVQQVFMTAWEQLERLEAPGALRAWLFGITRNMVRRLAKRRARRSSHEALPDLDAAREPASPALSPVDQAIAREDERLLESALRRLPERYRMPLVLHYRDQWSVEEVAEGLGVEQDAVRQRLTRGRRMLRVRLEALAQPRRPVAPRAGVVPAVMAAIATMHGRGARAAPRTALLHGGAAARTALLLSAAAGVAIVVGLASGLGARARPPQPASRPQASALSISAAATRARVPVFTAAPGDQREAAPAVAPALLEFDFDDGLAPAATQYGHISYCPPRAGNPHCMLADLAVEKGDQSNRAYWAAMFRRDPALFTNTDSAVLAFDYFLEVEGGRLFAKLTFLDGREYTAEIPKPVARAWGHAEVRLSTARWRGEPPPPGPVWRLSIFAHADQLDRPLYIDTVRVFERGVVAAR
jgi:RNA polymerase sigma factor (sigma-70 family)